MFVPVIRMHYISVQSLPSVKWLGDYTSSYYAATTVVSSIHSQVFLSSPGDSDVVHQMLHKSGVDYRHLTGNWVEVRRFPCDR